MVSDCDPFASDVVGREESSVAPTRSPDRGCRLATAWRDNIFPTNCAHLTNPLQPTNVRVLVALPRTGRPSRSAALSSPTRSGGTNFQSPWDAYPPRLDSSIALDRSFSSRLPSVLRHVDPAELLDVAGVCVATARAVVSRCLGVGTAVGRSD
jgi:hypothetical protein